MEESNPFAPDSLRKIEQLILDGDSEEAIDALERIKAGLEEPEERANLPVLGNNNSETQKEAISPHLSASSEYSPVLSAAETLTHLLFKLGYKREGLYFVNKIKQSLKSQTKTVFSFEQNIQSIINLHAGDISIAIHQPAYFPWLGYFHKIYYVDKFIMHDDVKFTKKSFIKRTLIRKGLSDDQIFLSIPAVKHSDYALIKDIVVHETIDWRTEHLRKIRSAYAKSEYFKELYPKIERIFYETQSENSLVKTTSIIIKSIMEILNFERPILFSSEIAPGKHYASAHDRNMEMCTALGGNIYFSGIGAIDSQREVILPKGLRLIYQEMWKYLDDSPYEMERNHIKGLSILDALFFIGPKRVIDIFETYDDVKNGFVRV